MNTPLPTSPYKCHRFPAEIISHCAAYVSIAQYFRPRCHLLPAPIYRQEMAQRFQPWQEITGATMAA